MDGGVGETGQARGDGVDGQADAPPPDALAPRVMS
jgi:hypothetical protein